jgi:hypothetical protein
MFHTGLQIDLMYSVIGSQDAVSEAYFEHRGSLLNGRLP